VFAPFVPRRCSGRHAGTLDVTTAVTGRCSARATCAGTHVETPLCAGAVAAWRRLDGHPRGRRPATQPAAAGRGHDRRSDHARSHRRPRRQRPPVAARPASDGWSTDASGRGGTHDAAGVCRCRQPRGARTGGRHGGAARVPLAASAARRPVTWSTRHRRSGTHDRRRGGVRRGRCCTDGGVAAGATPTDSGGPSGLRRGGRPASRTCVHDWRRGCDGAGGAPHFWP